MTIRPVTAAEYGPLGELTVQAYLSLRDGLDAGYAEQLRDVRTRAEQAEVLVAVDGDGVLLGGVTFVPDHGNPLAEWQDPQAAGFRMLAVDPERRGRGVGRLLTQACIERARAAGQARVLLHTRTSMRVAHRLYESMGFVRVPELDWTPMPGVDLLAYELWLQESVRRR